MMPAINTAEHESTLSDLLARGIDYWNALELVFGQIMQASAAPPRESGAA